MQARSLMDRLSICPPGNPGWKEFEKVCIEILSYLFVPPLSPPKIQQRTFSALDIRDAVFPNRNFNSQNPWGYLLAELQARMILFEFKNYDSQDIGKEEVDQTHSYMTQPMGRLGIICCNKHPTGNAQKRCNKIYSDNRKVILFILPEHLREMILMKERGQDPADFVMDKLEEFYLQHE